MIISQVVPRPQNQKGIPEPDKDQKPRKDFL